MGNFIDNTTHVYRHVAQNVVEEIAPRPVSTPSIERLIAEHAIYKKENEQLHIKNEQLKKDCAQFAAQLSRLMNNVAKEKHQT